MATITLTDEQVTDVLAPSKRYAEAEYAAILAEARTERTPLGHVETAFPGVKPAHVVFMLKRLRGDAKDVTIDSHGAYGVCVIPVTPKPAAKPKPKPAAKKPARKPSGRKASSTRKTA